MKKKYSFALLVLLFALVFASCGENQKITPPEIEIPTNPLLFGTDQTLDIVTWNLREFPLTTNTISLLVDIIPQMEVEVFAVQEIMEPARLYELASYLPDYEALVYNYGTGWCLGYLYDSTKVEFKNEYMIYTGMGRPFPRPPYVLKIGYENQDYFLINNHFKALGDNYVDESDDWDEEMRRREASALLEEYISSYLPDQRVIMLGDLNDQIQEPRTTNVFLPFLDKPDDYLFATMPIALHPTYNTVSYPTYNSIIDHILITNELFNDFDAAGKVCRVILVENVLGGYSSYNSLISDHRPVGIRLGRAD